MLLVLLLLLLLCKWAGAIVSRRHPRDQSRGRGEVGGATPTSCGRPLSYTHCERATRSSDVTSRRHSRCVQVYAFCLFVVWCVCIACPLWLMRVFVRLLGACVLEGGGEGGESGGGGAVCCCDGGRRKVNKVDISF